MRSSLSRFLLIAGVGGAVVAASPAARAFDWNARTGSFETEFGNTGYFTPASGHTLASACAVDEASRRAASDPALAADLARAFGTTAPGGLHDVARSVPYQLITFGDWGNEIFTNIGLEGRATHADAGEFLKGRYHNWITADGAKAVYLDAKTSDGYSSTYYLHSQAIDGKTQDESFNAVRTHVKDAIAASIAKLEEADRKGIALPKFENAFHGFQPKDCNERCQGLVFLGSVFHTLEDSSVSCSPAAKAALGAEGKGSCEMGDGHTVVDWTSAGRPQVVTLSDDSFYQTRTDVHANLDGLYTDCDTDHYRYTNDAGATFDFNPKLVNASVLDEVAHAVAQGEDPKEAADRIWRDVVSPQFAAPDDRKPMPPVPAATSGDGVGGAVGSVDSWFGKAPWQPLTNKLWYGLGRFFGWASGQPPATSSPVNGGDVYDSSQPQGPMGWNDYRNSDTTPRPDDAPGGEGSSGGAGVPH